MSSEVVDAGTEELLPCEWCKVRPEMTRMPYTEKIKSVRCQNEDCPVRSYGWMSVERWTRTRTRATPSPSGDAEKEARESPLPSQVMQDTLIKATDIVNRWRSCYYSIHQKMKQTPIAAADLVEAIASTLSSHMNTSTDAEAIRKAFEDIAHLARERVNVPASEVYGLLERIDRRTSVALAELSARSERSDDKPKSNQAAIDLLTRWLNEHPHIDYDPHLERIRQMINENSLSDREHYPTKDSAAVSPERVAEIREKYGPAVTTHRLRNGDVVLWQGMPCELLNDAHAIVREGVISPEPTLEDLALQAAAHLDKAEDNQSHLIAFALRAGVPSARNRSAESTPEAWQQAQHLVTFLIDYGVSLAVRGKTVQEVKDDLKAHFATALLSRSNGGYKDGVRACINEVKTLRDEWAEIVNEDRMWTLWTNAANKIITALESLSATTKGSDDADN